MRRGKSEAPVSFFSFQDVMMCTIGLTILVTLILILQLGAEVSSAARGDASPSRAIRTPDDPDLRRLEELTATLARRQRERTDDPNASLARSRAELLELGVRLDSARSRAEDARRSLEDALAEASLDPRSSIAVDLMRRRDVLQEALAESRRRSRITYLISEAGDLPPTIVELAQGRAVVSFDAESEAPLALLGSDPGALASRVLDAFVSREDWRERYLLIVLKPSGIPAWEKLMAEIRDDPRYEDISTGLDLIPEAQWTSDAFLPAVEITR